MTTDSQPSPTPSGSANPAHPDPDHPDPDHLPTELRQHLEALLGDELPAFVAAQREPGARGVRIHPRKTDLDTVAALLDVPATPVGWCPTGLRLPSDHPRLGQRRSHRAGLYYAQEPSAMSPTEVLAASLGRMLRGARVLDLAAAPGGKTTRLTELVGPDGLVVANEVERKRLNALHENLDRWGATNVVTTNLPVDALTEVSTATFDAVLLDAPCSGEGMFRRDPRAAAHWSPAAVRGAARRQARLLDSAAELVAPGGVLVYSTCTFAVEENEERIAAFARDHPAWTIEPSRIALASATASAEDFSPGVVTDDQPTDRMLRLWPHRVYGDGHVVAVLRHDAHDGAGQLSAPTPSSRRHRSAVSARPGQVTSAWTEFARQAAPDLSELPTLERADRVFGVPMTPLPVRQDALVRPGLPLGRAKPGRFEPTPALAGRLAANEVTQSVEWPDDDPRWDQYLGGAEVPDPGPQGWVLVTANGWGLGWARRRGETLKNFLPVRLRTRGSGRG